MDIFFNPSIFVCFVFCSYFIRGILSTPAEIQRSPKGHISVVKNIVRLEVTVETTNVFDMVY